MTTDQPVTIIMTLSKETKGSFRYDAPADSEAPVRDLYIKKSAFAGSCRPDRLRITLQPA